MPFRVEHTGIQAGGADRFFFHSSAAGLTYVELGQVHFQFRVIRIVCFQAVRFAAGHTLRFE